MTKTELIAKVAESAGITKAAAGKAVECVTLSITDAVSKGDKVTLTGFGTFSASERKEHNGINPKTGEKIVIPAKTVPTFKAGASFKEAVNG